MSHSKLQRPKIDRIWSQLTLRFIQGKYVSTIHKQIELLAKMHYYFNLNHEV